MAGDQQLVDLLEAVWRSLDDACADLTEEQWKAPTDLPGWSVQDNLAHIVGIESMIAGRPAPDHTPPELPHVKNDIGRSNEVWVDARRSSPGSRVLAEFRDVTRERISRLRGYSESDFAAESWTPAGPGTVRDLLPFRVFDSWAHEQDIRRAVGRPGDLEGPVADLVFERVVGAMPYVVGKKVHPPDGTTVAFALTGPSRTVAIGVDGGRASPLPEAPPHPSVTITMGREAFACLGLGRWDRAEAEGRGGVTVTGDEDLGRAVLDRMNFLF